MTAEHKADATAAHPAYSIANLLAHVLTSLADDKAEDVIQIDLCGKAPFGDYMVIASGASTRRVTTMAQNLVERLKADPGISCCVEGKEAGDWVLVDTGDIIVNIFRPEIRKFYQLEKLWMPAPGMFAPN
ncbi:MAG: ribosome silencing factor [Rhodobacteraceae bacterium]|nr:ribosome silencing factor [Paracoccaceae bacterium]